MCPATQNDEGRRPHHGPGAPVTIVCSITAQTFDVLRVLLLCSSFFSRRAALTRSILPAAPQHIHKSLTYTPYESLWIPSSARFVSMGITPRAKGMLQVCLA